MALVCSLITTVGCIWKVIYGSFQCSAVFLWRTSLTQTHTHTHTLCPPILKNVKA